MYISGYYSTKLDEEDIITSGIYNKNGDGGCLEWILTKTIPKSYEKAIFCFEYDGHLKFYIFSFWDNRVTLFKTKEWNKMIKFCSIYDLFPLQTKIQNEFLVFSNEQFPNYNDIDETEKLDEDMNDEWNIYCGIIQ